MSAEKLFQKDVYIKEFEAVVTGISEYRGKRYVTLSETAFFPVGGGQSCDTGMMRCGNASFDVTDVFEREGDILHETIYSEDEKGFPLSEGDKVYCTIDWKRRFDNMQRHCGEHILSGIFHREYGGVNRGFHMGEEYMTVDMSLEDDERYTEITWEMAMHVQDLVNEVIWSNLPVTVRRFKTKSEAETLPLRKKLAIEEDISIVCVGDENDPSDCVACCGTHPAFSGQVGLLKILKIENNKGMFRIYFEAGKRAMKKYDQYYDLITELGQKYSAGADDLEQKINAHEEKQEKVKDELRSLRRSVISQRADRIRDDICKSSVKRSYAPLIYSFDDMKTNDLMNLGKPFIGKTPLMIAICAENENTVLLFSDGEPDCGRYVKEKAAAAGGKGGGNAESARVRFPDADSVKRFIGSIKESE